MLREAHEGKERNRVHTRYLAKKFRRKSSRIIHSGPQLLLKEKLDDLHSKVAPTNTVQGCLARGLVERGEKRRREGWAWSRDSPRFGVVSEMPRSGQIGERHKIHKSLMRGPTR